MSITLKSFKEESDAVNPARQTEMQCPSNIQDVLNTFLEGVPLGQFESVNISTTEAISGFFGTVVYKEDSDNPTPITPGTGDKRKQVIILDDSDSTALESAVNAAIGSFDPDTTQVMDGAEEAFGRLVSTIVYEKTY